MNWLKWYDNIIDIVLSIPRHLRSPKSEFGWKSYDQNTNHCAANLSPYGPYKNSYDPYAPYPKIQTELTTAV
jgi:hypothetical protein